MEQFTAKRLASLLPIAVLLYVLPFVLSAAVLPEATRLVVLAGTAMCLNLLVGTTGLISLGQGLFLGFGAYVVAIANIRFGMSYWTAGLIAVVVAVPLSLLVGLISLRARHLFFGLLTLAIGQVAFVWVVGHYKLTGGDDGLVGVTVPAWLDSETAKHFFAVTVMLAVSVGLLKLLASPFGTILAAIRDNSDRVASLGGNPRLHELAAMVATGTLGAVFGVVNAGTEGSVDAHLFFWTTSAMLLNMIALGGRSIFLGPLLGAVILEVSRAWVQAHSSNADLVVGGLVILCAVLFPEGVGPPVKKYFQRHLGRRAAGDEAPALVDPAGGKQ
jgi:branched-chain amino acid transport system permease protein